MPKNLRVRTVKRKEIDEDKLALAFFLLAKVLQEQDSGEDQDDETANATASGAGAA
jgi:hypothetical protein